MARVASLVASSSRKDIFNLFSVVVVSFAAIAALFVWHDPLDLLWRLAANEGALGSISPPGVTGSRRESCWCHGRDQFRFDSDPLP